MNWKFWEKSVEQINPSMQSIEKIVKRNEEATGTPVTKDFKNNDFAINNNLTNSDDLHRFMSAPVSTNKEERLAEYRYMSTYPEVSDAIDEIAESMYNINEDDDFMKLKIKTPEKFKGDKVDVLKKEFSYFTSLFDFDENSFDYSRKFIVEGELAFENVIDPKNPKKGILSVRLLDNDKYELLKDLTNGENIGILFNVPKKSTQEILSPSFTKGSSYFRELDVYSNSRSYIDNFQDGTKIPMLWSQLTYINSGIYDCNRTFVYPVLDKARQPYKQLKLIESSVIIYRVSRSPERLVFNIASGNLTGPKAQQMLNKLMRKFNMRKKTTEKTTGGKTITNGYDSHQSLESYWFLKPENGEGSNVESIGGSTDFSELEDLKLFTRRLYRSLKVPFSRTEQPENTVTQNEDITYDEFKFARFVVRLQNDFASGILDGFSTHLKLKGLWKKYKMTNKDLMVELTAPALYDLYQKAKLTEIKMELFSNVADNEYLSAKLAMKKILNWSDDEIKENTNALLDESNEEAEREYWAEQISEYGSYTKAKKAIADDQK